MYKHFNQESKGMDQVGRFVLVLQDYAKIHLKTLGLKVRSGFSWRRMGVAFFSSTISL
jgi:hypothetical protein